MPIQVSEFKIETRYLTSDETGETWVKIRPPDYEAETQRAEMLKHRVVEVDDGGLPRTRVDVNTRTLYAEEIWLTYQDTNLVVEFVADDEKVTEKITFEPRDKMTRLEFMQKLARLPVGIVYDWHNQVLDVVPGWAFPF